MLIATVPITAAGLLANTTATWFWRSLRWMLAAILMKPALALVLVVGVNMLSGPHRGRWAARRRRRPADLAVLPAGAVPAAGFRGARAPVRRVGPVRPRPRCRIRRARAADSYAEQVNTARFDAAAPGGRRLAAAAAGRAAVRAGTARSPRRPGSAAPAEPARRRTRRARGRVGERPATDTRPTGRARSRTPAAARARLAASADGRPPAGLPTGRARARAGAPRNRGPPVPRVSRGGAHPRAGAESHRRQPDPARPVRPIGRRPARRESR